MLRRRPVLSTAVTATIGLAIAATTVAFAVVNGVLLRPLPYAEPGRLAVIWERKISGNGTDQHDKNVASPGNFLAWRDELTSFDRLATFMQTSGTVTGDGEPEQVGILQASASYFAMVGAQPLVGRLYREAEDVEGGPRVVVLSEGYWRRRFAAKPDVVGKTIALNGVAAEVVGVLPSRYDFVPRYSFGALGTRDVWYPPQFAASARNWGGRYLEVVGRLAPGKTVTLAQQEAAALANQLAVRFPKSQEGWSINVVPLHTDLVGDVRTSVLVVFGAVIFVLLIACSNVANLLLIRATERHQEMAVRAALGADRRKLVRLFLDESLVLATLGGIAGLTLAAWGIKALVAGAPDLPRLDAVRLDVRVIGFAVFTALGTALVFSLAPAAQLSSRRLSQWLTERGASGRRETNRIRNLLVGGQVALSFMLLVGAGLMVKSLINRFRVGIGFEPAHLLTAEVSIPGRTDAERTDRFERIVEQVKAVPGVDQAGAASVVPMSGENQATGFEIVGCPPASPSQAPVADVRFVHRDYLRTLGVPLIAGRPLALEDRAGAPIHVLINQTGAKILWPGESAVGKRITMEWADTLRAEIVGVVGDVRLNPEQPVTGTTLYWDYRQAGNPYKMVLVVRTKAPTETIVPAIRAAVRTVDPSLPLYSIRTFDQLRSEVVARARFTTVSLSLFAVLAFLLAGLGLYGVMAYATQQREGEIGVRMALGADRASIVGMVLKHGIGVVGPALALGAVGAFAVSRLLQSLVFDVSLIDPMMYLTVAVLLGASSFLACWLPARRASVIDPVTAIRAE
jgi:putative ABC transport system permease protein